MCIRDSSSSCNSNANDFFGNCVELDPRILIVPRPSKSGLLFKYARVPFVPINIAETGIGDDSLGALPNVLNTSTGSGDEKFPITVSETTNVRVTVVLGANPGTKHF